MSVANPTQAEITARSLSEKQIEFQIRAFNEAPMRGYLLHLLSEEVRKQHLTLEDVKPEELEKVQGKILGLKWFHTVIENNFKNQTKNPPQT